MSKAILITGATGNQGGAVLDALVKQRNDDFILIALTRNAESPAAKRMVEKSKSVRVLQGDMNQPDSIFVEAQKLVGAPVWGVFMVQSVLVDGVTGEREEVQGKAFVDACASHGVKMLVYSSVDRGGDVQSLQDPTFVSVFASKHRIEQHLFKTAEQSSMSWFLLRPTGLIEPLLREGMIGNIIRTSWKVYMKPNKPLQWVSCKDVGHFAAQGFLHPEQWSKKSLSLAAWEGTFDEANNVHKAVYGQGMATTFGLLARFICGVVIKDLSVSYQWYNGKGFGADIDQVRRLHPGLLSLEDVLRENKARK